MQAMVLFRLSPEQRHKTGFMYRWLSKTINNAAFKAGILVKIGRHGKAQWVANNNTGLLFNFIVLDIVAPGGGDPDPGALEKFKDGLDMAGLELWVYDGDGPSMVSHTH